MSGCRLWVSLNAPLRKQEKFLWSKSQRLSVFIQRVCLTLTCTSVSGRPATGTAVLKVFCCFRVCNFLKKDKRCWWLIVHLLLVIIHPINISLSLTWMVSELSVSGPQLFKTQLASFSDVCETGSDFKVKQCSDLLRLLCISCGQTALLVAIVTTNSSHPTLLDRSCRRPARPTEDGYVPRWFMELPHRKILLASLLKLPLSAAKVAAVRLMLGVRLAEKLS